MVKQSKKTQLTVIQPQQSIDQEIDILQEDLNDDLIKTLTASDTKTISTIKEKQKKVLEFKSRVLELVEIFLQTTKNPTIFIERVFPFIKIISDFRNPSKIQYINRVCKLLHSIISKGDVAEHLDNMQECCNTLIQYIHKCQEKSINKKFIELLDLLFKQISQHNTKIVASVILKALVLMRKNSNIDAQNIRKLIFNYPFVIVPIVIKLAKLSQIDEHFDRSKYTFSNLLFSLIQNDKFKQTLIEKEKVKIALVELAQNALNNYQQQKYKKVATFRQIMQSYQLLNLDDLKEQIEQFQSEDQNVLHIVNKLK